MILGVLDNIAQNTLSLTRLFLAWLVVHRGVHQHFAHAAPVQDGLERSSGIRQGYQANDEGQKRQAALSSSSVDRRSRQVAVESDQDPSKRSTSPAWWQIGLSEGPKPTSPISSF